MHSRSAQHQMCGQFPGIATRREEKIASSGISPSTGIDPKSASSLTSAFPRAQSPGSPVFPGKPSITSFEPEVLRPVLDVDAIRVSEN